MKGERTGIRNSGRRAKTASCCRRARFSSWDDGENEETGRAEPTGASENTAWMGYTKENMVEIQPNGVWETTQLPQLSLLLKIAHNSRRWDFGEGQYKETRTLAGIPAGSRAMTALWDFLFANKPRNADRESDTSA